MLRQNHLLRSTCKHPALVLSLAIGLGLAVIVLVDVLPYYGHCSFVHHDGNLFVVAAAFLILTFLGFLGWAGADVLFWLVSRKHRTNPLGSILAVPLLLISFLIPGNVAHKLEHNAIERFTERMQPTIDAIEAHVARTGLPPEQLTHPAPRMCEQELQYKRSADRWSLNLVLVESWREDEYVRYRSDGEHHSRESVINGWAWGRWYD